MRRLGTGLLALALTLVAAPSAFGQAKGEVGDPPTSDFIGIPNIKGSKFFPKPRSKPIVIGVGPTAAGRIEIIGQASTVGVCILVHRLKSGSFVGECPLGPPEGAVIRTGSAEWGPRRKGLLSGISGIATAATRSVMVTIEHKGRQKNVLAVVANPDAAIRERLGISEPFAYFHAYFPGCIQPQKTIASAYDALGAQLGVFRGRRMAGPGVCRLAKRGTSTWIGGNSTDAGTIVIGGSAPVAAVRRLEVRSGARPGARLALRL